jgi:transposase
VAIFPSKLLEEIEMGRRIKYVVRLATNERKTLLELIKKGNASKEKLNRARILLKCDCGEEGENWPDDKIAEAFYVSEKTVFNVRQSLVEEGLDKALNRASQKNRKSRIIQGEEEAYLVALSCSEPPNGHCKWTLRLLADKMVELEYVDSVSHVTIGDALKKMKLNHGKKKNGAYLQRPMQNSFAKWRKH